MTAVVMRLVLNGLQDGWRGWLVNSLKYEQERADPGTWQTAAGCVSDGSVHSAGRMVLSLQLPCCFELLVLSECFQMLVDVKVKYPCPLSPPFSMIQGWFAQYLIRVCHC